MPLSSAIMDSSYNVAQTIYFTCDNSANVYPRKNKVQEGGPIQVRKTVDLKVGFNPINESPT